MKYLATLSLMLMMVVGAFAQDKTADEFKNEGNAALKAKKYKDALALYEKAIAGWGADADAATVYNAATCARKIDAHQKAVDLYKKAIELNYNADACTYYVGGAYGDLNQNDKMEETYVAGIEKFKTGKSVAAMKKKLAQYYVIQSNELYAEGQKILNSRVDGNRDEWDAIKEKAKAIFDQSEELANKALKYEPTNANAKTILEGIKTMMAS